MAEGSGSGTSRNDFEKKKEANRQRALERLKSTKERMKSNQSGGGTTAANTAGSRVEKASTDGSSTSNHSTAARSGQQRRNGNDDRVSEKFKNYIDYDFSKMKDTRGGYIVDEGPEAPKGMTLEEWKAKQKDARPPYPIDHPDAPKCYDCGTTDLDFRLYNWFGTRICKECRNKNPEKYSLLTKTECKEDYLLTDPELRDEEVLKHVEKPNPHQSTYHNMMLYMRYQVEEFAFKKWGSPEALDAEYERRVEAKKKKKDKKFMQKLKEMRRNTRAETITKRDYGTHTHKWSESTKLRNNMVSRKCEICGMMTEELSFDL